MVDKEKFMAAMSKEEINDIVKKSKRNDKVTLEVNSFDLKNGISLKSNRSYTIKVHTIRPSLRIDLEIDPNDSATHDDKYTLFSTDENCSYYKELTVKDDKVDGDNKITLEYDDIIENLNYSLEIDTGAQGLKYFIFEDIPYSDLKNN